MNRWAGLLLIAAAGAAGAAEAPKPAIIAPLAVRSLLLDVSEVPGGGLAVVGERGHILASHDGGVTWTQQPAPARSGLNAVTFADDRHGWAVGDDEVILRTVDGGASWQLSHYDPAKEQPLLAVWFEDASHGLAIGAFAAMYSTVDGGEHWRALEFTSTPLVAPAKRDPRASAATKAAEAMKDDEGITQPHLNAIARGGNGQLYLAGEAGHLYRSTDRGGSWLELPSPYEGSFLGLVPLDGDSLLVFGLRGHLYRSDDAGRSWQQLTSHTESLLAGGKRLAGGLVVIVGNAGTVLVSSDDGHTFTLHQQPDRKGLASVAATPEGVVIAGESGLRRLTRAALVGGS